MTATHPTRSETRAAPPLTRRGGRSRETVLFLIGIALIALHVLDDNFLQPQPGTSPGDHLVGGLVPLALLGLAAWAYPRLRGGRRGALALALGVLGIAAGIEGYYYARELGPSGDDFTGLLAMLAGVMLLGLGAVTLWRTRRTDGRLSWRYPRRALLGFAGVLVAAWVVLPIGLGYVTTHTGRAVVPPNHLGVAYEDVTFKTSDGLELEGWYVPSKNGAAVIAFPGRNGPQKQTRVLARHGYGVLLFDRRGEGKSEGDPNSWGWGGGKDVKAAIAYLKRRPDVDPGRIGGIGLSVGGEMMLETAAETDDLAAVVSEGAGARTMSEDLDQDMPRVEKVIGFPLTALKTASIAVFSNTPVPSNLKDLVGRIAPRPLLLIAAPDSGHGEDLNRGYHRAAGDSATLWEIPESKHVGGLAARPEEYERRVVGFFNEALL
ncbi:MAG TPA: CocE/NonD family hydrolase [Solirubrobacteraceae bacterium]|nr:CocE/NonD family hydrolase [Solirubrobacteraceae bacterium]